MMMMMMMVVIIIIIRNEIRALFDRHASSSMAFSYVSHMENI